VLGGGEDSTTVVFEYPREWGPGVDPYYPVPGPDSDRLRRRYERMAAELSDTTFVGRLATYRYLNMDEVVESALDAADVILAKLA
jgi:UDP-galactopyranose mutase